MRFPPLRIRGENWFGEYKIIFERLVRQGKWIKNKLKFQSKVWEREQLFIISSINVKEYIISLFFISCVQLILHDVHDVTKLHDRKTTFYNDYS